MLEREYSESKKFSCTISEIQNYVNLIEQDKKGYSLRLSGPDEGTLYDNYAMLFYGPSDGKKVLVPVTTEEKDKVEITSMIRDLSNPEEFDFSSIERINIDEKTRNQLMFDCVFSHVPIAMIAFGESEKTKQRSAVLYVIGNNSPQEIYTIIWHTADAFVGENRLRNILPDEGQCS